MDLLLDVDIVVDVCAKRTPFHDAACSAIQLCRVRGGKLWMYSGSAQTLQYTLYNELMRSYAEQGMTPTPPQGMARTRELLGGFSADKQWLAALAAEGDIFDAADAEAEQMLRALDRFPSGTVRLLTRDASLLEAFPERTVSPQRYCQSAAPERSIEFIDLASQQGAIRAQLELNIHRVLHHGQYIMGPEVRQLEERLAEYVGARHCITASSGTDTLLIAMMALGIGPGAEVITTPFTFVATGEMIVLLGATPVFVDIDPRTYNIDHTRIEAAITANTRAIMPVSLYGQCADMDAINAIANRHGLPVIEDAAQSFGASYKGKRSCALSTIGSTSFFPSKPLGGYGDGGALFTDDDALAKAMREIRVHGQDRRYHHPRIGINGRFDTLQAAVVLAKMDRFAWEVEQRRKVGARYTAMLASRCPKVTLPYVEPHNTSVYAQYSILVENRDAVAKRLNELGVPTAVHYPIPLTLQPAYRDGCRHNGVPTTEFVAARIISLPIHADLPEALQERIVAALSAVEQIELKS